MNIKINSLNIKSILGSYLSLKNNEILHHTFNNVRNFCVGAKKDNTSQYTTLITDKKKVIEIKNKGEIKKSIEYFITAHL